MESILLKRIIFIMGQLKVFLLNFKTPVSGFCVIFALFHKLTLQTDFCNYFRNNFANSLTTLIFQYFFSRKKGGNYFRQKFIRDLNLSKFMMADFREKKCQNLVSFETSLSGQVGYNRGYDHG